MKILHRLAIPTLAILCLLFVHQVILLAPHPRTGKPIRKPHYDINLSRFTELQFTLGDERGVLKTAAAQLESTYVPSHLDESLENALKEAAVMTFNSRVVANLKHMIYRALQYFGWSHSDASGFVRRAHLYVASTEQFQALLPEINVSLVDASQVIQVVDVGSGSGTETAKLAEALELSISINPPPATTKNPLQHVNVTCFESAASLRHQLRSRGFTVADSLEEIADNSIHVGALLNVLDRCDNPIDLVRAMLQKLRQATSEQYDGGYLMIGIVMPFKGGQVLEGTWGNDGKSASRRPRNRLVLPSITATKKRKGWTEFQAAHFYAGLLHHIPQLEVVRWTRLPYVSIGGIQFTHSTLDMVLMVLRRPRSGTNNNNDSTETVPLPEGENEIESVGKDGSEDPAEMDKTEL